MQHIDRLNVIKALVLLEDEQIVRFNIAANDNAPRRSCSLTVWARADMSPAAGMISHRTAYHPVLGN